ncbi:MAG: hypothetical protein IJP90_12050 [Treponema sp.]|nr:hypothetical protein [Treponema sp.]
MTVREPTMPYGIKRETLDFIRQNSSPDTLRAIERYYEVSLGELNP